MSSAKYSTGKSNRNQTIQKGGEGSVEVFDPSGQFNAVSKSVSDGPTVRMKRQRWESENGLVINSHALQRWDQRTDPDSVSPERAWSEGVNVTWIRFYFTNRNGERPKEVRVHADSRMILIKRGGTLKTVLPVDDITYPPVKSYIATLINGQNYDWFDGDDYGMHKKYLQHFQN